ncbi:MAG: hypothetical protein CL608_21345 [Anaerolineaceae bacterium]|nr:hypothetical protein [Anaerolineaceae bacterium]
MNIALWVVQIFLALLFIAAGAQKLMQSREVLMQGSFTAYAADFPSGFLKLLGVLEILGGLGVVLPHATGIMPWLTPLAAMGLAIIMAMAANLRLRRGEQQMAIVTAVFMLMALFVVYGRYTLGI